MNPEITVTFDERAAAMDYLELAKGATLATSLQLADPLREPDHWSDIRIFELLWPTSGSKFRTRASTFTPRQWTKVRQRALDDDAVMTVTLQPEGPFDESPGLGLPATESDGTFPGPVRLTLMPDGRGGAEVRLNMTPEPPTDLDMSGVVGLFRTMVAEAVASGGFRLAALGANGLHIPLQSVQVGGELDPVAVFASRSMPVTEIDEIVALACGVVDRSDGVLAYLEPSFRTDFGGLME